MDALTLLSDAQVAEAVEAAYDVFQYPFIPRIEVCRCAHCVSDADYEALIHTPVRQLPHRVLTEYTHSAHGVPADTTELKRLVPRYLELIAADAPPDDLRIGRVLARVGDMRRANASALTEAEREALDKWANAVIRSGLDRAAGDARANLDPAGLLEVLIAGGWSARSLASAYDLAFKGQGGAARQAAFSSALFRCAKPGKPDLDFLLPAAEFAPSVASDIADWMGSAAFLKTLERNLLDASGAPPGSATEAALYQLYDPLHRGVSPRFVHSD